MSLNGLDDPNVVEAHQAGVAEPGGWFLLKYASRDEVELMDRGNGGIVEIRKAVAGYDEESPLYGYLRYRRRNVLIKYLPEDCSRLIQARVAVHFNAVCERFSPYDTIFEITTASELRDTKLSAACSLHAASGSNSSSTSSLRRRRLMEIAEEEDEEEQRAPKRQSVVAETDGERPRSPTEKSHVTDQVTLNSDLASSPEQSKFSAATTSDVPKFVGVSDRPASPARSIDTTDSRSDIYSLSSYTGKPRVKLAPRPSLEVGIRPQTAGNFRPVSSIPAGVKLFGKGQKKSKAKDTNNTATSPQEEIPEMDFSIISTTTPEDPTGGSADGSRPATSSGVSIASLPVPALPTKQSMTPEKARLMKAMKLREKKRKQQQAISASVTVTSDLAGVNEEREPDDAGEKGVNVSEETTIDNEADENKIDEEVQLSKADKYEEPVVPEETWPASISQPDSGVALSAESSVLTDQISDATHSDSRAESPAIASSELDQSTAASSLSESTDETVHGKEQDDLETNVTEDPDPCVVSEVEDQPLIENVSASVMPEIHVVTDVIGAEAEEAAIKSALKENATPDAEISELLTVDDKEEEPVIEGPATELDEAGATAEEHQQKLTDKMAFKTDVPEITVENKEPNESLNHAPGETDSADETPEDRKILQFSDKTNEEAVVRADGSEEQIVTVTSAVMTNDMPEADGDNDSMAKTLEDKRQPVAVPISKFSANIPASPDASKSAPSGVLVSETLADMRTTIVDVTQQSVQDQPASPPYRVPRSKFSTQDLAAAAKAASQTIVVTPLMELEKDPLSTAGAAIEITHAEETPFQDETIQEMAGRDEPEKLAKKIISIPPIKTDFNDESRTASRASDNDLDDALMDELSSATVEEAKPMTVAKSPLTPVFPSPSIANRPASAGGPLAHTVRTVSNPVRGNLIVPSDVTQSSARSLSSGAAYLHKVTQQQPSAASLSTMKPNVGSSISQRIKALEMLSAQTGDQSSRPGSRERPSSTFFAVQKKDTARSPSVADRTKSLKQTPPSPTPSQDSSPETTSRVRLQRSGSVVSRLSMFETLPSPVVTGLSPPIQPRGRPESVSVTAKIIRDPYHPSNLDPPKDISEYNYLDLKQSPLVVDHHAAEYGSQSADDKGRRPSLGRVTGFFKDHQKPTSTTNVHQPTVLKSSRSPTRPATSAHQTTTAHRQSMSSRRSSFGKDREGLSQSGTTEGSVSGDDKSEKKMSRAGRFMRRLSNLSGASKVKSPTTLSPPPVFESQPTAPIVTQKPAAVPTDSPANSIVSELGDVNVQFPDNLLWKRRNLTLDSQGFIILSALPAQSGRTAQGTKRYHMSEFRQPYTPDVEVQELPNSVVLDFIEGAGIQLACEDRNGQLDVLKVLRNAHSSHGTFGR